MKIKRGLKDLKRFKEVSEVLSKFGLDFILHKNKPKKTTPKNLVDAFAELGGSFVKLGQLLSIRPDLVPLDYAREFSRLQDSVKPEPLTKISRTIKGSITGKAIRNITSKPIASASIAQVHKAHLQNGNSVIVKIKRSDIEEIMQEDLDIIKTLAHFLKKYYDLGFVDPVEIYEELKDYTDKELDFVLESRKQKEFEKVLKGTQINVPKVYFDISNDKIIVMEFIEGKKLQDIINSDDSKLKKELSSKITNSFFEMVLNKGLFHADPHPGNFLIKKDGSIYLLDYGITGHVDDDAKKNLLQMFISLITKDKKKLIESMVALHFAEKYDQKTERELSDLLAPYYDVPIGKVDFPKLFIQSIKLAKRNNIRIPKDYVLLGKALITLESVCKELNPEFNIVQESKGFIQKEMFSKYAPGNIKKKAFGVLGEITLIPSKLKAYGNVQKAQEKQLELVNQELSKLQRKLDVGYEQNFLIIFGTVLILGGYILFAETGQTLIPIIIGLLGVSFFVSSESIRRRTS